MNEMYTGLFLISKYTMTLIIANTIVIQVVIQSYPPWHQGGILISSELTPYPFTLFVS